MVSSTMRSIAVVVANTQTENTRLYGTLVGKISFIEK